MKVKKIESICKSSKSIMILEDGSAQWLGNGEAMYMLDNMPALDESTVFTLFDIAEKEREKYYVKRSRYPGEMFSLGYNFTDNDKTEQIIERMPITISYLGHTAIPFKADIGALYIENRYLAPFHKTDGEYELYVRYTELGVPYVAVKRGLLIIAIINPCSTFFGKSYAAALNDLQAYSLLSYNINLQMFGDNDPFDGSEPIGILGEAERQAQNAEEQLEIDAEE